MFVCEGGGRVGEETHALVKKLRVRGMNDDGGREGGREVLLSWVY